MSKKLYEETNISSIADGIRYANGGSDTYQTSQMPAAVRALKKTLVAKTITESGTYDPSDDDADGYSQVVVNVSGGPRMEKSISVNGVYTAENDNVYGYSKVTVDVQPTLKTKSITVNGTYAAASDNADGFSEVSVNVTPRLIANVVIHDNGVYPVPTGYDAITGVTVNVPTTDPPLATDLDNVLYIEEDFQTDAPTITTGTLSGDKIYAAAAA